MSIGRHGRPSLQMGFVVQTVCLAGLTSRKVWLVEYNDEKSENDVQHDVRKSFLFVPHLRKRDSCSFPRLFLLTLQRVSDFLFIWIRYIYLLMITN
eukprot:gene11581-7977_t